MSERDRFGLPAPGSTLEGRSGSWIWGVIWTREDVKPTDEVSWYDSKEEAIAEYNNRGDKYWHCPLVRATINPPVLVHEAPSPFEHGYDNFYYRES